MLLSTISLRTRFVLIAVLPTLLMALTLALTVGLRLSDEYKEQTDANARILADSVASSLEASVKARNTNYIYSVLCEKLHGQVGILSIEVFDKNRASLGLCKNPNEIIDASHIDMPIESMSEEVSQPASATTLEKNSQRVRIGTVRIAYTNKQTRDRLLSWVGPVTVSFLLEMCFGVLISFYLSRKIFLAIAEMVYASENLTKRDFKPEFESMLQGEFGVLQQAFLDMSMTMKNYTADLERKVDQRTADLEHQKILLEQATEDKRLLIAKNNQAIEHERRKIAFDLHDTMNTIVLSMMGHARSAKMILERLHQPEQLSSPIDSMKSIEMDASKIYKLSRDLVSNLRPEVLDDFGLDEALGYLVDKHQQADRDCTYHYQRMQGFPTFTYDFNIVVYRILQECLSNITKHAQATTCDIALTHQETPQGIYITLTIKDNGTGFDPSLRTQSTGLVGMSERAESIGGKLLIKSDIGKGTQMTFAALKKIAH